MTTQADRGLVGTTELTAIREALRPIAEPGTPREVGTALLAFMANDPGAAALSVADQLRVLSLLRREGMVSPAAADAIKLFEDRSCLRQSTSPERALRRLKKCMRGFCPSPPRIDRTYSSMRTPC